MLGFFNEFKPKGSQQKSLFGKIDDGYNSLNTNLADLDKRTSDFVAQTKLFERADGLKLDLEDSIEVMKKDIGKLQGFGEEVQEIESRLSNAKKTTDEVNSKLSKLQGERRRVEDMDSEFKKLITISRDLDLRIEAVYSSQDTLQEIQSKIRELENLGKLTESSYERLEKKKSIIETTTAGVDKSFQMLESLEKNLGKIGSEVGAFGEQMKSLKVQTDLLSNNKDKADAVVDKLEGIDTVLEKLEARMEKLDIARGSLKKLLSEARSREQFFKKSIDHSVESAHQRLEEKLKAMEKSASKMLSRTESREENFSKSIDLSFAGAERRLTGQRKLLEDTAKNGEALEKKVFSNLKSLISRDAAALSKSSEALKKRLTEMDAFGGELKGGLNDLKEL